MVVKMNLRIIPKNHAAALEIGFLLKSISKHNGHADSVGDKLYLSTSRKLFRKLFLDFVFFLRQLKFDPVGKKVFGSSRCFRL